MNDRPGNADKEQGKQAAYECLSAPCPGGTRFGLLREVHPAIMPDVCHLSVKRIAQTQTGSGYPTAAAKTSDLAARPDRPLLLSGCAEFGKKACPAEQTRGKCWKS